MKKDVPKMFVFLSLVLSVAAIVFALASMHQFESFISSIYQANDFYLPGMYREPYFRENPPVAKPISLTSPVYAKQEPVQTIEQKIVRTAEIQFEVENYKNSRAAIEQITKRYSAYIASGTEEHDDLHIKNSLFIRVPADQFFELIEALLVESIRLNSKSINSEDVTEKYVDNEARLKTKGEIEKRYLNILKQAKAVADILDIEEQLGKIREEIESTESRLNTLKNKITYSTIRLKFYETIQQMNQNQNKLLSKTINAFKQGGTSIIAVTIFLISLWPFLLILGVSLFFYRRMRKNRP